MSKSLVNSQQVISAAIQKGSWNENEKLADAAVLVLNGEILEKLTELCELKDIKWLTPDIHPYGAPRCVRKGKINDIELAVLVPPMGASPFSCIIEDLVGCGVKGIFLVCPAWSLGQPVDFGDMMIPSFSTGVDGTSVHYGNKDAYVDLDKRVVDILENICKKRAVKYHVGGNSTCEALYRVTPRMIDEFRQKGCISMENGEANTLFSMAKQLKFTAGILFQPYIDLNLGWRPELVDERCENACYTQADIILDAITEMRKQGML